MMPNTSNHNFLSIFKIMRFGDVDLAVKLNYADLWVEQEILRWGVRNLTLFSSLFEKGLIGLIRFRSKIELWGYPTFLEKFSNPWTWNWYFETKLFSLFRGRLSLGEGGGGGVTKNEIISLFACINWHIKPVVMGGS